MKFLCPSCKTKYQIADEKVVGRTLKMDCRKCTLAMVLRGDLPLGDDGALVVVPAAKPAGSAAAASKPASAESGAARPAPSMVGRVATPIAAPSATASASMSAPSAARAGAAPSAVEPGPLEQWHVAIRDVPVGPLSRDELALKIASGDVQPDSLAWREGYDDWKPVKDIPALAPMLRRGRPVVPAAPVRPADASAFQDFAGEDYDLEPTRVGASSKRSPQKPSLAARSVGVASPAKPAPSVAKAAVPPKALVPMKGAVPAKGPIAPSKAAADKAAADKAAADKAAADKAAADKAAADKAAADKAAADKAAAERAKEEAAAILAAKAAADAAARDAADKAAAERAKEEAAAILAAKAAADAAARADAAAKKEAAERSAARSETASRRGKKADSSPPIAAAPTPASAKGPTASAQDDLLPDPFGADAPPASAPPPAPTAVVPVALPMAAVAPVQAQPPTVAPLLAPPSAVAPLDAPSARPAEPRRALPIGAWIGIAGAMSFGIAMAVMIAPRLLGPAPVAPVSAAAVVPPVPSASVGPVSATVVAEVPDPPPVDPTPTAPVAPAIPPPEAAEAATPAAPDDARAAAGAPRRATAPTGPAAGATAATKAASDAVFDRFRDDSASGTASLQARPVRTEPADSARAGAASGEGLSAEQIRTVVQREQRGLQSLLGASSLRRMPTLPETRLDVDLTVGASGTVTQATTRGTGVGNLGACIERSVRRWRFPQSGDTSQASFPMVFRGAN